MSSSPTVLVDMDGVMADFVGLTSTHLRQNHPDIPVVEHTAFYYREDYPDPAHQKIISQIHCSQFFFRDMPPVKGALEGWQRIKELGYHPVICTAPLRANPWCQPEKLQWVEYYLGPEAAHEAVVDKHKESHDGIALIDDRPVLKNAHDATWQHVVFDTSYNQDSPSSLRLNGWDDPNLETILAECARIYRSNL